MGNICNLCIYSPVGFLVVTIVPLPYLTDSQDEDIVTPKFPTEPEETCEVYSVCEGGEDLDPSEPNLIQVCYRNTTFFSYTHPYLR